MRLDQGQAGAFEFEITPAEFDLAATWIADNFEASPDSLAVGALTRILEAKGFRVRSDPNDYRHIFASK